LFFFILTTVQFNTYRKAECNQESRKKIKRRYGLSINNSTEYFRQEDFKSQQKWKTFEKYVVHNRKILKNTKRKNRRLKKKCNDFKSLLKSLKSLNFLSDNAGEFLKVNYTLWF